MTVTVAYQVPNSIKAVKQVLWSWSQSLKRYRITDAGAKATGHKKGTIVGHEQMLSLRDEFLESQKARLDQLCTDLVGNELTRRQFVLGFREALKETYLSEYALAVGGRHRLGKQDYGRLGQMLKKQYEFLQGFERDLKEGKYSGVDLQAVLGQIQTRARMYIDSAVQAFESGKLASYGEGLYEVLRRDYQIPGDGTTPCLCITSPYSRVLTKSGWKSLIDVQVGDCVFTHKLRWRRVVDKVIKSSQPYHRQVYIRAPGGRWVGATDNHLWYTNKGWLSSSNIDSREVLLYHLLEQTFFGEVSDEEVLSEVRFSPIEYREACSLQEVPIDMSVWQNEGFSGRAMCFLRNEQEGKRAMGTDAPQDGESYSKGRQEIETYVSRPELEYQMAAEIRQPLLDIYLGERSEEDYLSLSMGVDCSQWTNTRRVPHSPQEWRSIRRQARKSGTDAGERSCADAWTIGSLESLEEYSRMDLSFLRQDIQAVSEKGEHEAKILLSGMLPPGTPLYDLTVEEDHSFVIEGLFAHNTNCRCHLSIKDKGDHWEVRWVLALKAEHCSGPGSCPELSREWKPLRIDKPVLKHLRGKHDQSTHNPGQGGSQSTRVWTGKQESGTTTLTKLQRGAVGEKLVMQVLSEKFGVPFDTLNVGMNNAPIDIAGDHRAIEVKTGLSTNTLKEWRATIGEPGKAEKALLKQMTPEQKSLHNEEKKRKILERKEALLKRMTSEAGEEIKGGTVGVILSPDGKRADMFMVDGFHLRLPWSKFAADEYYLGTFDVPESAMKWVLDMAEEMEKGGEQELEIKAEEGGDIMAQAMAVFEQELDAEVEVAFQRWKKLLDNGKLGIKRRRKKGGEEASGSSK